MLKAQMIGYIGNDAVVKAIPNTDKTVVEFSIAHTSKWADSDGVLQEKTVWVGCSMWNKDKIAQHLKQGTQVWVEGTPEANAYMKDDKAIATLRLRVTQLEFCSSKKADK